MPAQLQQRLSLSRQDKLQQFPSFWSEPLKKSRMVKIQFDRECRRQSDGQSTCSFLSYTCNAEKKKLRETEKTMYKSLPPLQRTTSFLLYIRLQSSVFRHRSSPKNESETRDISEFNMRFSFKKKLEQKLSVFG